MGIKFAMSDCNKSRSSLAPRIFSPKDSTTPPPLGCIIAKLTKSIDNKFKMQYNILGS